MLFQIDIRKEMVSSISILRDIAKQRFVLVELVEAYSKLSSWKNRVYNRMPLRESSNIT